MPAELDTPFNFGDIASEAQHPTQREPFFLSARVPFPETCRTDIHKSIAYKLKEYWELAEADFVTMYQSEVDGQALKEFFQEDIESREYTLTELAELVGVTKPDVIRKTRAVLQVGSNLEHTDITFWRFTQIEIAQYLVGLVGRKKRNMYTYLTHQNYSQEVV